MHWKSIRYINKKDINLTTARVFLREVSVKDCQIAVQLIRRKKLATVAHMKSSNCSSTNPKLQPWKSKLSLSHTSLMKKLLLDEDTPSLHTADY